VSVDDAVSCMGGRGMAVWAVGRVERMTAI
jgi:hypothetical protein